jgi:hypothetical protein
METTKQRKQKPEKGGNNCICICNKRRFFGIRLTRIGATGTASADA